MLTIKGRAPSRVTDDYDAASAFVEVMAEPGKDVVLRFEPDGSGQVDNVILNGFAIDAVNPARQAIKPTPSHGDEHVRATDAHLDAGEVRNGPPRLRRHRRYGRGRATPTSPEFRKEQSTTEFTTAGLTLSHWATYFWRVDEVPADGR